VTGGQWPMPRRRGGHTAAVTIGSERFYLTANQRDDGSLGEVFMHWGKHGTSGAGLVSTYAIALSVGLRHLVPLADLIRPGLGQYFAPNGLTDDPEIPAVGSAVDYVARLDLNQLAGGVLSAIPADELPPPSQRRVFAEQLGRALGGRKHVEEHVQVAIVVGRLSDPNSPNSPN